MSGLNILVADDHTLVSRGVRRILEEQPGWQVIAEAANGRDAVRLGSELKPDVAVIDVSMPSLNGIEAAAKLAEEAPGTKVLMLSMHADEALVGRALRAGARGYVLKDSADAELVRAVAAVAAGESFFSHTVANRILEDYVGHVAEQDPSDRFARLSAREREVFQLVVEGKSSRQIAELLGVRPATIETHRAHVFEKLGVHSTAELVRYAARKGMIN